MIQPLHVAQHAGHAEPFQDCQDAMSSLMWHKNHKSVCALVLTIVKFAHIMTDLSS